MFSKVLIAATAAIAAALPAQDRNTDAPPGCKRMASLHNPYNDVFVDTNDPVMGGGSTSSYERSDDGVGVFSGTVRNVSFLHAPGFCKITGAVAMVDISSFADGKNNAIWIHARSSTPEYGGFRVAFGGSGVPQTQRHSRYGTYKSGFAVPGNNWTYVKVPMEAFSYDWSEYTGRCDTHDPGRGGKTGTQHHCCSSPPADPKVCPAADTIGKITSVELWAEGVEGEFHLEFDWVGAGPTDQPPPPLALA